MPQPIELSEDETGVDVTIDGDPFGRYRFGTEASFLKKPVFYPLRTARGTPITRGFPLDSREGERVDHPHHIGLWLNHGNVNGLDFWNNSDAIESDRAPEMGTIVHRSVESTEDGQLVVTADWCDHEGAVELTERTVLSFEGTQESRIIDRTTRLTASEGPVEFRDDKEGFLGLRVRRELEHPSDEAVTLTDRHGNEVTVEAGGQTKPTGEYLSSSGTTGTNVWGERARWVSLRGTIEEESIAVTIMDHPDNPNHPTHWHARGYGLFAANPLGEAIFTDEASQFDHALEAGASTTFRYRLQIDNDEPSAETLEKRYQRFLEA